MSPFIKPYIIVKRQDSILYSYVVDRLVIWLLWSPWPMQWSTRNGFIIYGYIPIAMANISHDLFPLYAARVYRESITLAQFLRLSYKFYIDGCNHNHIYAILVTFVHICIYRISCLGLRRLCQHNFWHNRHWKA